VRTRTGRGVGLPKTRRNFFTKENYPQRYRDKEMAKKVQFERDKLFDKILAA